MKVYKVGDKVTIKSLDWYNENKDKDGTVNVGSHFVDDMSQHCGKTTVITRVLSAPNRYHVECDPEYYDWSAEMFEGNEEETMKYKVGDKVKLKSKEWYDNHEKDSDGFIRSEIISFNPEMSKYLGKVATITNCYDNSYDLDIDDGYWSWSDYMIECKVDDAEPKQSFEEGDFVQIKSEEWFEENKNEDGIILENEIIFDEEYCGKVGEIIEYDSSDETYKVQFDPDGESNYQWFTSNWMDKVDKPDGWIIKKNDKEDDEESDYNMPTKGDWVMVADKYSEESPREDWTIATFVGARSKGIDTEEGIWNYCIPFKEFSPGDWEYTIDQIYKGEDRKLIKVDEDE